MENTIFSDDLMYLFACRNIWQYLWITGDKHKSMYPKSNDYMNECPCCEYVSDLSIGIGYSVNDDGIDIKCSEFCLLSGFAWSKHEGCELDKESFYKLWDNTSTKCYNGYPLNDLLKYYAGRMVYACNIAIEKALLKSNMFGVENESNTIYCPLCKNTCEENENEIM